MSMMTVVTGATGHVGAVVVDALLAAGKKVRVVGRDATKLARFAKADQAVGSLEDFDFVAKCFQGATSAFVMIPPNLGLKDGGFRAYQNRVVNTTLEAVRKAGTKHVVTLSSIGAHVPVGNGPVGGLYDLERAYAGHSALNALHLRPGYFFENTLGNIGMIKHMGLMGSPMAPNTPVAMIATQDIGRVAARRLLELDFKGQSTLELMGPADITMDEVTKIVGTAIGKPDLRYVQFPYDEAIRGMVQAGLTHEMATLYAELTRGFNEGLRATQPRSAATTTPTTFAAWAKEVFLPAFQAA